MASRLRHRTEPFFGWLFVIVAIALLAVVFHIATKPVPNRADRPPYSNVTP